jgi:chromosome segregation ATPase
MNNRLRIAALGTSALIFLPAAPAQASWEEIRCGVAIPAAQAATTAARLALRAAENALPSAQRRLDQARANLKKATTAHRSLTERAAAAPNDLTLAEQVRRSEATLNARRAAVASAASALSAAKMALPKARSAAEASERKLKDLRSTCPA